MEFANRDVAKIVAEAMNNYLMFEKVLKCKLHRRHHIRVRIHIIRIFIITTAELAGPSAHFPLPLAWSGRNLSSAVSSG